MLERELRLVVVRVHFAIALCSSQAAVELASSLRRIDAPRTRTSVGPWLTSAAFSLPSVDSSCSKGLRGFRGDPGVGALGRDRRRAAPTLRSMTPRRNAIRAKHGGEMGPLVVGIAGGTGSGKTTVAKTIASALPSDQVVMIEYDAYYRDLPDLSPDDRALRNFDHPDALETELFVEHLSALRHNRGVDVPIYDFKTHRRKVESRRVEPAPVVIAEGILVFVDPRVRERLDMKIFVDTDADIRVFRRIRRDMEQRGRTFESIREQYYRTVRPMHLQFVEPSKRWADLIIPEGGNNKVALDLIIAKLESVLARAAKVTEG